MSRIGKTFRKLRRENAKAFIPYIMAGYPDIESSKKLIRTLEECGADIIELGVPFSDPLADGPAIQQAAQAALESGVTLHRVIELVGSIRNSVTIPLILMTYYNPVFKYGEEKFVRDATAAGVDGVIVPDLPPDEAGSLIRLSKKAGFDTVFLIAPTSTDERIRKIARASSGFIYYVSMTGITGSRLSMDASIASHISGIRKETDKAVAVGFGISTPEEAAVVSEFADGVIVGSAIVKRARDNDEDLRSFLVSLRKAIP